MAVGRSRARQALLLTVIAAAACSGPGSGSGPAGSPPTAVPSSATRSSAPPVTIHEVAPETADPDVSGPSLENLALVGSQGVWNGDLVVFLPGTGDQPSCCQLFLTEAADLGFHVIGLSYDNASAVVTTCGNDLACYGVVHRNVFNGTEASRYSDVPPEDGIERRLATLLAYLEQTYPDEGWGRFLSGTVPRYASVVLAGHSQGGAEAAYIATARRVAGVVTLSAPPDTDNSLRPATWLAGVRTGKTPVARYYGFVHRDDLAGTRISADWQAMGLAAFGPLTSVDGARAPYGGSHELVSAAALPEPGAAAAHDGTAIDAMQPLCPDGSPEYAAVWAYLLQAAAGLALTGPVSGCGA